ncbi:hypothetical protein FBU30_003524 [Linnemannia zychae]|nr:hypothetical protein FBU30_003524 [Linnemannia zychae]
MAAKVFVEPGRPSIIYCEKCYIEKFSKGSCPACYKPVLTKSDPYITHNKRSWHTACFACFKCRVNLSTKPMVDLKGRPCCEDCLMAQAGTGQSPVQEGERTFGDSLTPVDRSLSSSPAPSPHRYPTSLRASNNDVDVTLDLTKRLSLNTSPGDPNADYNSAITNSPLSAQSYSSQSSFGAPYKTNISSGNTSGTSSTHSSLGRNKLPEHGSTSLLKNEQGLSAGGSLFSYQRPGSALSIHSYTSSRPTSPAPPSLSERDSRYDSTEDLDSTLQDKGSGANGAEWNNRSEPTYHGLRSSRSRSPGGVDTDSSLSRSSTNGESKYQMNEQPNSRPLTPSSKSSVLDAYPSSIKVDSCVPDPKPTLQQSQQSQQPLHPPINRTRSRSTVSSNPYGMVKARTEAWLNVSQTTTPAAKTPSHQSNIPGRTNGLGTDHKNVTSYNTTFKQSNINLSEKDARDPRAIAPSPEIEPNRPSLQRHGRQRSNTVGEAISFPAVKVDSPITSPSQQRAAVPDGHCHKCFERVTENGVRLPNGDRYHIGCFLCNGCKQVFTESEFHVVYGRPYHPSCVSMAGTSSMMGVITKCQQCHKVINNRAIRFSGQSFHPQCFTCTHCHQVLHSTSKFFEVDGRVECEQCCEERDRVRLAPKIVPVARGADHFPTAPSMVASGPGLMATTTTSIMTGASHGEIPRSGSVYGSPLSANASSTSSPLRSPGSPGFPYSSSTTQLLDSRDQLDGEGVGSPVLVMGSPTTIQSTPPPLTSLFSTRTRPLPKFGGVMNCPRCQQAIGVMDQVPGPKGEKWHKKCLNCKVCKKVLDSSALTRGEGEAFCRGCFNKTRGRA